MSLAGYNTEVTSIRFADPAAASLILNLLKAPAVGMVLKAAYMISDATFNADGSNYYSISLLDGGADGTGTTSIASWGGASVDTVANTAQALTISADGLDGGDWLRVAYAETGTVAPGNNTVVVHWTQGGS